MKSTLILERVRREETTNLHLSSRGGELIEQQLHSLLREQRGSSEA